MTNVVNRIGFPDETPCPDCGRLITGEEDAIGVVYQCTSLDCGSTYTGEDLFPENYREEKTQPTMTPPKDQAPGLVAELRRTPSWPTLGNAAADRITQLEANLEAAIEAITIIAEHSDDRPLKAMAARTLKALTEQANIRSPVQSLVRDQYNPEDEK